MNRAGCFTCTAFFFLGATVASMGGHALACLTAAFAAWVMAEAVSTRRSR